MSAFYPFPKGPGLPSEYYALFALAVVVAALTIWSMRKTRVVAFGIGFYLVTVALVLQFVSVGSAILADRYTYVPYVGLSFILGMGYYNLVHGKYRGLQSLKSLAMPAMVILGLIFAVVTFQRTEVWRNSETVFTNVIKNYPTAAVAYQNRGHYYRQRSDDAGVTPQERQAYLSKAMADYNNGLTYAPKNAALYSNRGKIWFERQQYDKALEDYNKSVEIDSNRVETLVNRAAVFGLKQRYQEALKDLSRAIELDPNYINAYYNRGILYSSTGQSNEAIQDYTTYLGFKPNDDGIYNSRGVEYQRLGKYQESIQDFTKAIELTQQSIVNLQRNTSPAARVKLKRLSNDQAVYYGNRSLSYRQLGQTNLADQDAQRVRQLRGQ